MVKQEIIQAQRLSNKKEIIKMWCWERKKSSASNKYIYFCQKKKKKKKQEKVLQKQWLNFINTHYIYRFLCVLINFNKYKYESHSYDEDEGAETLCQALTDQQVTNLEEAEEFLQIHLLFAHVSCLWRQMRL